MEPPSHNTQLVQLQRQPRVTDGDFYALINSLETEKQERMKAHQLPYGKLSSKIAKNLVTPADAPVPDCLPCGACCHLLYCAPIKPGEEKALPPETYWEITVTTDIGEFVIDRYFRRQSPVPNCVALKGRVGESVACSVYENRPRNCRDFDAGSDRCHALRRACGLEPQLTPVELEEAGQRLAQKADDDKDKILFVETLVNEDGRRLTLQAWLGDYSKKELHTFDPLEESWLQNEFSNLTIAEAEKLIAAHSSQEKQ
jgi:hypothetical protein